LVAQKAEDKVSSIVEVFYQCLGIQNTLIEEVPNNSIDADRAILDDGFRHTDEDVVEEAPVRLGGAVFVVRMEDVEYVDW
jgi:hypothetical protein